METPIPSDYREKIEKMPGLDGTALLSALDTAPGVSLRYNRRKTGAEEIAGLYPDMTEVEWCREGRRLKERPVFTLNPLLHAGAFYVQDASSMIYSAIVEELVHRLKDNGGVNLHRPIRLLDCCAAPGGKTTAMINALPDDAEVVANEYEPRRGKILRENLEKWGFGNVITTGDDTAAFENMQGVFDIVAVDAPCSGEGMMRKDEDARRQWSEKLVDGCARLQREILDNVSRCVCPGGYLIYSTCTFNTRENEDNARYIREMGYEPVSLTLAGTQMAGSAIGDDVIGMRFMPHITEGEGLFVAVFQRPVADPVGIMNIKRTKRGKSKAKELNLEKIDWVRDGVELLSGDEIVTALPKSMMPLLELLRGHGVNVTGAGLPVGIIKDKTIIPDSRVVLSTLSNPDAFPIVDLTEEEALRYLRREALVLPPDTPRGYVCVSYHGHPLGLVKNIGNRANNLYPSQWKIRK